MNNLSLNFNYITNFSPKINKNFKKHEKKIFLRSFFIFVLCLKQHKTINKISIFIKPKQYRSFVMLRAPYRYKLARLQLTLNRYNVFIKIIIKKKNFFLISDFFKLKNNLLNLTLDLETVFMHTQKTKITAHIKEKHSFLLKNF